MIQILVLHPKQIDPDELGVLVTRVKEHADIVRYVPAGQVWMVKSAREEFLEFEKRYGKPVDWDRWKRFLLSTKETFSADPRFDIFVVAPEAIVGRATAETVTMALKQNRTVLRLTPNDTIVPASKVTTLDVENFTRGWVVS